MSDNFYGEWQTRQRIANEWQATVLHAVLLIAVAAVIIALWVAR